MAELADAPDLGSGGRPCRFKSCYPHYDEKGEDKSPRFFHVAQTEPRTWQVRVFASLWSAQSRGPPDLVRPVIRTIICIYDGNREGFGLL